jgi:hypothetical protein
MAFSGYFAARQDPIRSAVEDRRDPANEIAEPPSVPHPNRIFQKQFGCPLLFAAPSSVNQHVLSPPTNCVFKQMDIPPFRLRC